jgi:hypothetical protein
MLSLRLGYQQIFSLYSEGPLAGVGFPCSCELTWKLTGNFSVFETARVLIRMAYGNQNLMAVTKCLRGCHWNIRLEQHLWS